MNGQEISSIIALKAGVRRDNRKSSDDVMATSDKEGKDRKSVFYVFVVIIAVAQWQSRRECRTGG